MVLWTELTEIAGEGCGCGCTDGGRLVARWEAVLVLFECSWCRAICVSTDGEACCKAYAGGRERSSKGKAAEVGFDEPPAWAIGDKPMAGRGILSFLRLQLPCSHGSGSQMRLGCVKEGDPARQWGYCKVEHGVTREHDIATSR